MLNVQCSMEYIIKSALTLSLLYSLFFVFLRKETFHRFNRCCLLFTLVASLLLPLVHISTSHPTAVNKTVMAGTTYLTELPAIVVTAETKTPLFTWTNVLASIYWIGLCAMLLYLALQVIQMYQMMKGGLQHTDNMGNTIILKNDVKSPFSIFHYIVMSVEDYENYRQNILTHEQEHIRMGHSYDLLLLEVVKVLQWFNPFVYLLGRDLKAIHEYEADNAVLNFGIDAKTYQLLLVTKAVGGRLQTVCNNLSHHSLKKRIKMMHTHNSNRWLMSKALVLPALMALAIVAFAKPKVEEIIASNETALPAVEGNNQVQGDKPVTFAVPGMGLVMTDEVKGFSEKKMLNAFIPNDKAKDFIRKHGPAISVFWLKGTWVVRDGSSYIEEHPDCRYPWAFHTKYYKVMLDGKELDVNNLPDLPASALKKVEMETKSKSGKLTINLTTKPVQIPASIKGNINPELTILLTGTPPKDSGAKTTIWERRGNFDGFSWKNYTICSWKWDVDDISVHLKEVAIRSDHSVRINVCKGVPHEHIDRIKRIMSECGVTNYKFVHQ